MCVSHCIRVSVSVSLTASQCRCLSLSVVDAIICCSHAREKMYMSERLADDSTSIVVAVCEFVLDSMDPDLEEKAPPQSGVRNTCTGTTVCRRHNC